MELLQNLMMGFGVVLLGTLVDAGHASGQVMLGTPCDFGLLRPPGRPDGGTPGSGGGAQLYRRLRAQNAKWRVRKRPQTGQPNTKRRRAAIMPFDPFVTLSQRVRWGPI